MKVAREQVYDFVDREWEECEYSKSGNPESYEVKGMIIEFLNSVGIKVANDAQDAQSAKSQ
jgi:hypothetical protein